MIIVFRLVEEKFSSFVPNWLLMMLMMKRNHLILHNIGMKRCVAALMKYHVILNEMFTGTHRDSRVYILLLSLSCIAKKFFYNLLIMHYKARESRYYNVNHHLG